ncbi:YrhB domain-containing protein [Roseateles sp.]|uniref:YrhB domain-containing protein n=1 Tax=Roseateles sp. TaxID=1971397 RepID=UPI0031D58C86
MLNYEDAIATAEKELANADDLPGGDSLVLLLQHTIERPFGWVFFYTSRLYRETGEARYALAGNAPFIVNRRSGEVVITGTARPVEQYIAEYEARFDLT